MKDEKSKLMEKILNRIEEIENEQEKRMYWEDGIRELINQYVDAMNGK